MRALLLFLLWAVTITPVMAQSFGGNPARQSWRQIRTDTVRIIFAPGLDSQAFRAATLIHRLAALDTLRLGSRVRPVNVVLQHQSVISNAYVQLGPFRSEWMLMPDLDNFGSGLLGWTDLLALHEYRHVEQLNNMQKGLSKVARILLGQQGYDLAINAAVPNWFFEGDAVWQETMFSSQGRGRLPLFMNAYPALWLSNKRYTWMKLRNGSLKDVVPDHYGMGYYLVRYGAERYGERFWPRVIERAASYRAVLYPFSSAVAATAGVRYREFIKRAWDWSRTQQPLTPVPTPAWVVPTQRRYASDMQYPYAIGKDSLLVQKSSRVHRPAFYLIDSMRQHRLRTRDIALDQPMAYRGGKLVYAAIEKDPRRDWVTYSSLRSFDLQRGKQTRLTHRTRYFTPDISPSLTQLVAVHVSEQGLASLHLLRATDGQWLRSFRSPNGYLYTDPKFISDTTVVVAARDQKGSMALLQLSLTDGQEQLLTPFLPFSVGFLHPFEGDIYFTAGYLGNDDIYCYRSKSNVLYKVSQGPLGKYNVQATATRLYWSVPTAEGYQVAVSPHDPQQWQRIEFDSLTAIATRDSARAGVSSWLSGVIGKPSGSLPASSYSKATGLLNFHSWRPDYQDPLYQFVVLGENVLNTFKTELVYQYNENERSQAVGATMVYGGWFPELSLGTTYTFERTATVRNVVRAWSQLDTRVGITIPLSDVHGRVFRHLSWSSYYVMRQDAYKGVYRDTIGTVRFGYFSHGLQFSVQAQRALQHIFPRWGLQASLLGQHSVAAYRGTQFNAGISVFLPGLTAQHHLVLQGAWQQRDTAGQLTFGNRMAYSRGYVGRYFSRMWKTGVNYHFPLLLPDIGWAQLLYVNRIRANMFYDYTRVYSKNKQQSAPQRSTGAEIFFDTKWFNQYPVSVGFRISRLLDKDQWDGYKGWFSELILPVSLF